MSAELVEYGVFGVVTKFDLEGTLDFSIAKSYVILTIVHGIFGVQLAQGVFLFKIALPVDLLGLHIGDSPFFARGEEQDVAGNILTIPHQKDISQNDILPFTLHKLLAIKARGLAVVLLLVGRVSIIRV